jgi:hypothetical protein
LSGRVGAGQDGAQDEAQLLAQLLARQLLDGGEIELVDEPLVQLTLELV